VLDIIDEERKGVSDMHHDDKKRQGESRFSSFAVNRSPPDVSAPALPASPTNIHQSLSKRPSIKLPKSQGRPRRGSTKASLGSIVSPVASTSGLSGPASLPHANGREPSGADAEVEAAGRESSTQPAARDGDLAMT
jgi:hypothetical protein